MRETTAKRTAMRATTGVLESAQIGSFFLALKKKCLAERVLLDKEKKKKKKKKRMEKENMKVMGLGVRVMISVDEENKRKRNEKVV
jgi:hypothetical protein